MGAASWACVRAHIISVSTVSCPTNPFHLPPQQCQCPLLAPMKFTLRASRQSCRISLPKEILSGLGQPLILPSTRSIQYKCSTRPPCVGSIKALSRAIMQPGRGAEASTYRCRPSLRMATASNACCSLQNDLRSLLGAIGPYIAEGSGASRLTTIAHHI